MQPSSPLLSICIPTFNRAGLLDVCLASLLPQVAAQLPVVECVVSDNCSSDATQQILTKYQGPFPFLRISRNTTNIGIIGNITKVASELANGEFVWLIGDDDIMTTGAVDRLIKRLHQSPSVDLVAFNIGYENGNRRPTSEQAWGGVVSQTEKTLRRAAVDGEFAFEQLFEGPCADLTSMYSLALRHSLWQQHYPVASTIDPFSSVESTYPHAAIIAEHLPGKRAGLIASPAIIIYEMPSEQFSWAKHHSKTILMWFTELLQRYERGGVPRKVLEPYYRYQLLHRSEELGDLMFNRHTSGGFRDGLKFAWMYRRYPALLTRSLLIACSHPHAPKLLSVPLRAWLKRRSAIRID
jgi:glycosyltransferase involved in cell wall biosynthesis